jgi:hypothetical protein
MDEVPVLGNHREQRVFHELLALHGPPAYIRRAQAVQGAWDQVVEKCRRQRDQWLSMARMRLGVLRALAGEWSALTSLLSAEDQLAVLAQLENELRPSVRQPVQPARSLRSLRRALRELVESLEYFQTRWQTFLSQVDLTEVNRLREDYNRYYVLEKECAVRSPRIARQGFVPLPPATVEGLAAAFPPLPTPAQKTFA